MGYTHYMTQKKRFPKAEWATIQADVIAVLDAASAAGIAIGDSHGELILFNHAEAFFDTETGPQCMFNGLGDDAHETMAFSRDVQPVEWSGQRKGWSFCKTAQKPYDVAVTAVLVYLESVYPQCLSVGSDGVPADWQAGLELARKALPRLADVLRIPAEVTAE